MKNKKILIGIIISLFLMCVISIVLIRSKLDKINVNTIVQSEGRDGKLSDLYELKEGFILTSKEEIEKLMVLCNIPVEYTYTKIVYIPLKNDMEKIGGNAEKLSELFVETNISQEIYQLYFSSWYMAPSGERHIDEIFEAQIDVKFDEKYENAIKKHYELNSLQFVSQVKTQEIGVKEGCKKNMTGYIIQEKNSFTVVDEKKHSCQGTIYIPRGLIVLVSDDIPAF